MTRPVDVTLRDTPVVITGAGSGLGRAYAIDCAQAGALVLVNDVRADLAHETVGVITAKGLSAVAHVVTVLALAGCGVVLHRGVAYAVAVATAASLLVYEHSLVRRRGLSAIDRAFFDVNAWVSVAFFALVLADELLRRFLAA